MKSIVSKVNDNTLDKTKWPLMFSITSTIWFNQTLFYQSKTISNGDGLNCRKKKIDKEIDKENSNSLNRLGELVREMES